MDWNAYRCSEKRREIMDAVHSEHPEYTTKQWADEVARRFREWHADYVKNS